MDKKWIGIILMLIGGMILLGNLGIYRGEYTLMVIGALLLIGYYASGKEVFIRKQGFLVAGAIVFMVGLFAVIEQNYLLGHDGGYLFFFLLGTAFLIVFFIHTRKLEHEKKGKQRWPIYPGLSLWGFALFIFAVQRLEMAISIRLLENLFPVALIVIGGSIILKNMMKKK